MTLQWEATITRMFQNSIWKWSGRGFFAGVTLGLAVLTLTIQLPRVAFAQELIEDFNRREVGSEPHLLTWSDSSIVFAATTQENGKEIWRYDLVSGASSLVLDHRVGEVSSFFRRLMAVNQNIAFLDYEEQLWVFEDGTLEAVQLSQPDTKIYGDPVEFRGRLYFAAYGDDRKDALWYSDGTAAGTGKVDFGKDADEFFYDTLVFGDSLYVVRKGEGQTALWVSGDHLLGFRKVADLGNVSTRKVEVADSLMFFFTSGSTISLWESDGTTAGTVRKFSWQEVQSNPDVYGLTPIDSGFVFVPESQQYPFEPFYTDGSLEGIRLLKDIMPGSVGSFPEDFVSTGSIVVFFPWTIEEGYTIWGTDGTSQGTIQLGDQRPGRENFYCGEAISFNGKIFFTADDGINGWELWESDGTPEGTRLFLDVFPGPVGSRVEKLLVAGGQLWFVASGPSGRELWSSDGTIAGTEVVTDLRNGVTASSNPRFVGDTDASLMFRVGNVLGTSRLFGLDHTDDTLAELDLGEDPPRGVFSGEWMRNALYFITSRPNGLWLSDGTSPGTIRLDSLDNNNPQLTEFGDHVYYYRADGEIWRTDGTAAGSEYFWTRSQGQSHYDDLMDATNDRLFFTEGVGTTKRLWLSDGTTDGTRQAYNVQVAEDPYKVFGTIGNRLVFSGAGAIRAVADTSKPDVLALIQVESGASAFGKDVAYFGSEGGPGIPDGLYRTDGSPAGTRLVARIDVQDPDGITQVNIAGNTVFFEGFSDWNTGRRGLFAFSESDDSLTQIADVVRDRQEQFVSGTGETQILGTVGQQLLFRGWDAEHGFELWVSDGTEHGTQLLIDLALGPNSSNPRDVFLSGGNVYFIADDGISGHELWVIPAVVLNTSDISESNPSGILVVEDAYPNPFQDRTRLTVTTAESGPVLVRLFDAVGRQVSTLFDGPIPSSGTLSLDVGGSSLGAGIYFVQVESREERQTVKLVHVK